MKKNRISTILTRKNLLIAGFFLILLFMMIPHGYSTGLFCDEGDNIVGAKFIVSGGVIYKGFFSQHTPLMYYIMAIFVKLGITGLFALRMCFYTIIISSLAFFYFRYKNIFGYKTFLFFPAFFIMDISRQMLMNTILSDMVQALAIFALFCEFYKYAIEKPKRISKSSIIIISVAIMFAIGVAFMSVYAIAVILFGVFLIDTKSFYKDKALKTSSKIKDLILRHLPVVVTLFIMAAIWAIYFMANGVLKGALYQSFVFNIKEYSKYIHQPNFIVTPVVVFENYMNFISSSFSELYKLSSIQNVILILGNVFFCVYHFNKNKIVSITSALFLIMCGIRGFQDFHATAYVLISWFFVAFLINKIIGFLREKKYVHRVACRTVAVVLIIICFTPYLEKVSSVRNLKKFEVITSSPWDEYIKKYVPENGYVYNTGLDLELYLFNDIIPATFVTTGLCPWVANVFMQNILDDINENKPNIIIYDPNYEIWGYRYSDYCGALEDLLYRDYVISSESDIDGISHPNVWLRKDTLNVTQLNDEFFYSLTSVFKMTDENSGDMFIDSANIKKEGNQYISTMPDAQLYLDPALFDSNDEQCFIRITLNSDADDMFCIYYKTHDKMTYSEDHVYKKTYSEGNATFIFSIPSGTDALRLDISENANAKIEILDFEIMRR